MYCRMDPVEIELLFGIVIPRYDGCHGRGKEPMTEKQIACIHNFGANIAGIKYKGQATVLIRFLCKRSRDCMATLPQIQEIRRQKIRCRKPVQYLTRNEASRILSRHLKKG